MPARNAYHTLVSSTAVAMLAFALVGCGLTDALDGTAWKLTAWSVSAIDPNDFTITATFAEGQIGGTGGVNSYGAPYKTGLGGSLAIGTITSTLMAGSAEAMAAESAYFALLGEAAAYELKGDTLTLFDDSGTAILIFTRQ